MRLYYIPTTAAMAPHAALAEAGADYELVLVERDAEGRSSAEYLESTRGAAFPRSRTTASS